MVKRFSLIAGILLFSQVVEAQNDRFGSQYDATPYSSFTVGNERNVMIASAPVIISSPGALIQESGMIVLDYVRCSGVQSSTITFLNTIVFDGVSGSTATIFRYEGNLGAQSEFEGNVLISSALSYDKQGLAPCHIGWYYTNLPKYGGQGEGK